jgi:hypothetical protein
VATLFSLASPRTCKMRRSLRLRERPLEIQIDRSGLGLFIGDRGDETSRAQVAKLDQQM